jgi:dipeptidyl aminopeptidase/acylaminoacyl peptidase
MRHLLRAAIVLCLSASAFAQPAPLQPPERSRIDGVPPIPMTIVDRVSPYGQFRQARLLGWHPTERRLLISTVFGNVSQVHEVRSPGGARAQLTFFRDGVTGGASYDPTGRYFVFRKDTSGGGEAMQLFRYDVESGAIALLTDGRSRHGVPAWSRRHGLIAFTSTRRNGKDRDLYVMNPLDSTSARMIAEVDGGWDALDWSPDGTHVLALQLIAGSTETRLWRIAVDSGERSLVTPKASPASRWTSAQFSSDGRAVYALSDRESEVLRIWRGDLASGAWTPVTDAGVAIEGFAASPAGASLAVVVDRGAISELQIHDEAPRRRRPASTLPPGVISGLSWHRSGTAVAIEFAGARTARDVYAVDVKSLRVERWTASEIGGARLESLPDAELIEWKSFDGRMIPGILYPPAGRFSGPRPVIINVHGGPELRERPRMLGRSNYFRNELGIAVIYPNIRGSSGYGRTYEHLDDGMKREDSVKDIGALLDWIATKPELDKKRVMITGSSYGGYITLAAAIAYGDRIRCAFEGFGLSDFVAFLDGTDPSRRRDRLAEYGDPSDPAIRKYLKGISPLTHAAGLKVPLFVVQGARDTRVPLDQAEAMVKAVRANGTPVWYAVYDMGHEEWTQTAVDYNTYAWVLFVQQYLIAD